ncbi:MAG TPA: hypothetical protein VK053_07135 [Jiangellaceae bacterium]|nr:hypothetical protein [Jiangellaceae bacterium]
MIRVALFALISLTTILALSFLVTYHVKTRGDWRWSHMGRHLFIFTACIALVAGLWTTVFVAAVADVDLPRWFDWLRLAAFASIPAVLFWRLRLLVRAQRDDIPAPDEETP